MNRRRLSSVLDVQSFRGADLIPEVRETLALSKQTTLRFHMDRFNLKKLNEVEGREEYWAAP